MDSNKLGDRLNLIGNIILAGLMVVFLIVIYVMQDLFLAIAGPEGPMFIFIYQIYYGCLLALGVIGIILAILGKKKGPNGLTGGIELLKSIGSLIIVTYVAIWSIILLTAVGDPSGPTITGMINLFIFIIVILGLLGGLFKIKGRNQ